jgi:small subunit ribosomal protein S6
LNRYETIFIVYAELPDEEITALIERYSDIVKAQSGTLIKIEKWGKRKLAYEIKKQSRGNYVLLDFAGSSAVVVELERNLRISDKILKYLTVKTKDAITLQEIEKEMAAGVVEEKAKEASSPADQDKPAEQEKPETSEKDVAATQSDDTPSTAEIDKEEKQ